MPDLMPPQQVLTATDAANQLQSKGLDALGLTIPALSSAWADQTPSAGDVDDQTMHLRLVNPRAPFRGILHHETAPTVYSDVAGAPIGGPIGVLALHPEAADRLAVLLSNLLGGALTRPTPVAMVVHGLTPAITPPVLNSVEAGEPLDSGGRTFDVTFHDERGLVIHPLAVASLLLALQQRFAALVFSAPTAPMPPLDGPGGLTAIAGLAAAPVVRVQAIDPHGNAYTPNREFGRLRVIKADGTASSDIADGGLAVVGAGESVGRTSAELSTEGSTAPFFWGLSHNSTLGRALVSIPAPPAFGAGITPLATQFFRLTAADLDWHLVGNRLATTVRGIPGDDDTVPWFAVPQVRPSVPNFDYLPDGLDVLGAANQVVSTVFPGGAAPVGVDVQAVLCSPSIDPAVAVPTGPGVAGHWPAFPLPNPATPLGSVDPATGITAAWRLPAATDAPDARHDVIVTIPPDALPPGTHLRVYPRRFVQIRAIGTQPSFVRGDGGATLAVAGTPSQVLLVNPFQLLPAAPLPDVPRLQVDVVAVGRDGRRRIASGVDVTLGAAAPWADNSALFGGTALLQTPALATLFAAFGFTSVAPVSLFGIARPAVAAAPATNILDLVRALANENVSPRIGPSLPTQARFETVLAAGAVRAAGAPYSWSALLTGARWAAESRSASPENADPGNPAGPDVHVTGVRVDGQLAQDLALHALKRAQPILPFSPAAPGWLIATAGTNWAPAPVDTTGTVAAVMLETIAPYCDSPELSPIPVPQPTDTVQSGVDAIAAALNISPPPRVNVVNEPQIRTRIQREIVTAKSGQRDALWSLRRVLGEAREFVLIDGPQFARTARPANGAGAPAPLAHELDLVDVLRQRLASNPRLKVFIIVPRVPDFDQRTDRFEPFVRAALAQRAEAITTLTASAGARVAAFHPVGFPGRPAVIRSSTIIVDDVWALVGTSHFRRRGMTFDGACDVVSIDRQLDARGTSTAIRRFRHELLAARLGVPVPTAPANSSALFTRLATPESAFDAVADLLATGGQGRCTPVWAGPTDADVLPRSATVSDPDGVDPTGAGLVSLFGDQLLT